MLKCLAIVYLLASCCLGSPAISSRIQGGGDASIENFPYAASIEWRDFGSVCVAVIVDSDWILTDAWCSVRTNFTEYAIRVGSAGADGGTIHSVAEWIKHPMADVFISEYDFALVKVDPPFEFNANVAAAALPALGQETPDGVVGIVVGWGKGDPDAPDKTLQYAPITLQSDATCSTLLGTNYNPRVLCARGASNDVAICVDDEGGPLVVDGILFGIALWPCANCPCASPGNAQKFGRVASVRDWIDTTTSA